MALEFGLATQKEDWEELLGSICSMSGGRSCVLRAAGKNRGELLLARNERKEMDSIRLGGG